MYQFDHLVHFVHQPEETMEQLQQQGLHVVRGGRHEAWGTYNALSYFDLSYIELFGIENKEKFLEAADEKYSLPASYKKNRFKSGFLRFAIRTTTIEQDAKNFAQAGFDIVGPQRFSRKREDGSEISWQLLYVGRADAKIELPFFIQWDEEDSIRRSELTERAVIAEHPLGVLKLEAIHFVVSNFNLVEHLAQLGGTTIARHVESEANAEYAIILLDQVKLIFAKPIGEGMVWDDMLENGYGIKKVVLSGAKEDKLLTIDGARYELIKSSNA